MSGNGELIQLHRSSNRKTGSCCTETEAAGTGEKINDRHTAPEKNGAAVYLNGPMTVDRKAG